MIILAGQQIPEITESIEDMGLRVASTYRPGFLVSSLQEDNGGGDPDTFSHLPDGSPVYRPMTGLEMSALLDYHRRQKLLTRSILNPDPHVGNKDLLD